MKIKQWIAKKLGLKVAQITDEYGKRTYRLVELYNEQDDWHVGEVAFTKKKKHIYLYADGKGRHWGRAVCHLKWKIVPARPPLELNLRAKPRDAS